MAKHYPRSHDKGRPDRISELGGLTDPDLRCVEHKIRIFLADLARLVYKAIRGNGFHDKHWNTGLDKKSTFSL
jgi:hypothetical protein